jgi:hypothetical protein
MSVLLYVFAAVLLWLGVDALRLSRHRSPPTQLQKDEMMFGSVPGPRSEILRTFAEKHYPFATGTSIQFYGWLFIFAGLIMGLVGWQI